MITLIAIIITGLLSWGITAALPALPWYSPFIIAFLCAAALSRSKNLAFLSGFLGVGLFWGISIALRHMANQGILTGQLADMFSEILGVSLSPALVIIIASLIGGLIGGLMAWSAKLLLGAPAPESRYSGKSRSQRSSYKLKLN